MVIHISPLANNRINDPYRNKSCEVEWVHIKKPFPAAAYQANEPEGSDSNYYVSQSTVKPSVE